MGTTIMTIFDEFQGNNNKEEEREYNLKKILNSIFALMLLKFGESKNKMYFNNAYQFQIILFVHNVSLFQSNVYVVE